MSFEIDALRPAPWGQGAAPLNVIAILTALINLLVHVPFTDLPSPLDLELGDLRHEYDYVVDEVGGGSAGSVIANRLSADPRVSVLLLEAGGPEAASRQIPLLAPYNLGGLDDWAYWSVPQRNACLSFREQRSPLPRGKVLGGTSVLNYMVYVRGNRHDYDRWATEYGARGWAYEDVLPHFKDIEAFHGRTPDDYHGATGEVPVEYANTTTPLSELFLHACEQAGYSNVDYNGHTQSGCSRLQTNMRNGVRVSASKAFIQPILKTRRNLHVAVYSHATKVNFEGRHAVGVSFTRFGEPQIVKARREVILSAGAVGSAQLLLLSGIGPKEDLEKLEIPVVADLPVGRSLQDHVISLNAVPITTDQYVVIPPVSRQDIERFARDRAGPISIPAGVEVLQFLNSDYTQTKPDSPDILVGIISSTPANDLARAEMLNTGFLPQAYDSYLGPLTDQPGFRAGLILDRPKSRGRITLQSRDPNNSPLIDPHLLEHPDDIKAMAWGTKKFVESMLSTDAMRSIGAQASHVPFPACTHAGAVWSMEYIECLYRHVAHMSWHTCCTAPMGSHPEAVVDERLRVRGNVTGLRVADASVMPDIPSGTTHAPCMMIGSKAAEMILEDNGRTEHGDSGVLAREAKPSTKPTKVDVSAHAEAGMGQLRTEL
ncbi:4-pyridoxate dehydrogenase-like [Haemaphysalis longicornis]